MEDINILLSCLQHIAEHDFEKENVQEIELKTHDIYIFLKREH